MFENRDIAGEVTIIGFEYPWKDEISDHEILLSYDISDEILGQKPDVLAAEEGFRGTLLTSSVSTQLCQDISIEWMSSHAT
jgi:hypothetical protein